MIFRNWQVLRLLVLAGSLFLGTFSSQANALSCEAGNLSLGGSSTGSLDAVNTSDIWCITTTADGALQVNLVYDPSTLQPELHLHDASNNDLAVYGSNNGNQLVSIPNLPPGSYFVEVRRLAGYGGYTVSNSFTAQPLTTDPEPNDNPSQALPLELGGMAMGHLGFGTPFAGIDVADWYKLTTTADGALQVNLVYDPSTLQPELHLHDASNNDLAVYGSNNGNQLVSI